MNGIALNEDNSHFFTSRAHQKMTMETVDAWVDQYARTQVSHLLLSPNAMRTSYGSRIWDPIWKGYDPQGADDQPLLASLLPEKRPLARNWIQTAWALDQSGIDVYARWIDGARRHGISPWLSMRMNDVHDVGDPRSYMHSDFWREHPEFRRVPYRFTAWTDRAFDYGRQEVREHHFRLIEELAQRYDFDGLELDWMRFGFHFRPGHEGEGSDILTAFTERVRRLLDGFEKTRGHRIRLGARVPSRPQTALGLGMDAVTWSRRGLIDWLVITPFWATIEPDMPARLWRSLLAGSGVELCAGLELLLKPYPGWQRQSNSLETARSAALALLHDGSDRIYLYNYMDSETTMDRSEDYPRLLRELGDPAAMARQPRRHVLTYADTWAEGEPPAVALPAKVRAGHACAFRLPIGPQPASGKAFVALALDPACGASGHDVNVRINGELCGQGEDVELQKPCPDEPVWRFPLSVKDLRPGHNVVEVEAKKPLSLTWVEIAIYPQ
ncbi:MAG: hypothetical protein R6X19_09405 [Kiritimatiellia bacterium]